MAEFTERTTEFFKQSVNRLADQLIKGDGMVLALSGTNKKVRLVEVEPFVKSSIGKNYKDWGIEDLTPGDLWNTPSRILQSLMIAREGRNIGACVRLTSAEYWDPFEEAFVERILDRQIPEPQEFRIGRESDIARFFGLQKFERSSLKFLDDSNTLYIVRDGQIYNRKFKQGGEISSDEANIQLANLLG